MWGESEWCDLGGGREGSSLGVGGSGLEVDVFVSSFVISSKERGLLGWLSNGFDGCSVVLFGLFCDIMRCFFVVEDWSVDMVVIYIRFVMFFSRKIYF